MKTLKVVLMLLLLGLISINSVDNAIDCCAKGETIDLNGEYCSDMKKVLPDCVGPRMLIVNGTMKYFNTFVIRLDSSGEYLDEYTQQFIVRSPNFCLVQERFMHLPNCLVVFCVNQQIKYTDLSVAIDEADNPDFYLSYWTEFDIAINVLSCTFYAIAFYIYYLVIPTRQIEDNCLLNLAGSMSIAHAALVYNNLTSQGVLPDVCITHLYIMNIFLLSGFFWYSLFMYYSWKKFKSEISLEDNAILKQFLIIGYGGPTLIVILAIIHAHIDKLYTEYQSEIECAFHQYLLVDVYQYGPILVSIGSNLYFWRDLIQRSGTMTVLTTGDEFDKKKLNNLLLLNRRLFYSLGLPWLLYIIVEELEEIFTIGILDFLWLAGDSITSGAGISVALILVMSRARVWQSLVKKYNFQFLQKWQPSDEEKSFTTLANNYSFTVSKSFPSDV